MPGKKSGLTRVLDDLEFEAEVDRESDVDIDIIFERVFTEDGGEWEEYPTGEFEPINTIREVRKTCGHCKQPVLVSIANEMEKHEGPCGRQCLGGGVSVGSLFHDDRCILCVFDGGIEALQRGGKKDSNS